MFWFLNFCKNLFLFSWFKFLMTSSSFLRSSFFLPPMTPFNLFFNFWILFIVLTALRSFEMLMFLLSAWRERFFLPLPMYAWLILALRDFKFSLLMLNFRFKLFSSRAFRMRSVRRFFSLELFWIFLAFFLWDSIFLGFMLKFFIIVSISFDLSFRSSVMYRRKAVSFSFLKLFASVDALFFTLIVVIFSKKSQLLNRAFRFSGLRLYLSRTNPMLFTFSRLFRRM